MKNLKATLALCLIGSAAQADSSMTDLQSAAAAIEAQLSKSTTLFMGITYTATSGGIA